MQQRQGLECIDPGQKDGFGIHGLLPAQDLARDFHFPAPALVPDCDSGLRADPNCARPLEFDPGSLSAKVLSLACIGMKGPARMKVTQALHAEETLLEVERSKRVFAKVLGKQHERGVRIARIRRFRLECQPDRSFHLQGHARGRIGIARTCLVKRLPQPRIRADFLACVADLHALLAGVALVFCWRGDCLEAKAGLQAADDPVGKSANGMWRLLQDGQDRRCRKRRLGIVGRRFGQRQQGALLRSRRLDPACVGQHDSALEPGIGALLPGLDRRLAGFRIGSLVARAQREPVAEPCGRRVVPLDGPEQCSRRQRLQPDRGRTLVDVAALVEGLLLEGKQVIVVCGQSGVSGWSQAQIGNRRAGSRSACRVDRVNDLERIDP